MVTGAAFLLNLGLFIVLFVITPLASGFVAGYLLQNSRDGWTSGLVGSTLAFSSLFLATEAIIGFSSQAFIVIAAVLLMASLGALGGLLGGYLSSRTKKSLLPQVSTTSLPGV
jgi:hypothetical protein